MENLLEHYFEMKKKYDHYEKELKKIKEKVKEKLKDEPSRGFENELYKVMVQKLKRTSISKNDIPSSLWEQYSIITPYEILSIREKKKKLVRKKGTNPITNDSS